MRILVLLLIGALLPFAPRSGVAQSVHFDGLSLIVKDGKRRIVLTNALEAVPETRVVHAVIKRGGDYYLVLGLREWSRGGPQPRGNCGGGTESYLAWLHVHDNKITERQAGLYASCFKNREGEVLGWKDGILLWQSSGERSVEREGKQESVPTNFSWTFDSARPEAGITEHTENIDSSPPALTSTPAPSPS